MLGIKPICLKLALKILIVILINFILKNIEYCNRVNGGQCASIIFGRNRNDAGRCEATKRENCEV